MAARVEDSNDTPPRWVDRPGPLGSLTELTWHEQGGLTPPDPVWQVRRYLLAIGRGDAPRKIHIRDLDALGGQKLSDHEVSRLEVLSALTLLDDGARADSERNVIVLALLRDMPRREVARRANCSLSTVYRRIRAGLGRMVAVIWDYQPVLPDDVVAAMLEEEDGPLSAGSCLGCGRLSRPGVPFVRGYCPGCHKETQGPPEAC